MKQAHHKKLLRDQQLKEEKERKEKERLERLANSDNHLEQQGE